jgi:hypothetical protein
MANENKYDSGHVVIPVVHPSEGIHNVSVPEDMSLSDLHSALLTDYALPAFEAQEKQPRKEDSLEYSEDFRKAAQDAWDAAGSGMQPIEAGLAINNYGKAGRITTHKHRGEKDPEVSIETYPNTMATLHTHTNYSSANPSQKDIAAAKKAHQTLYLVSKTGLHCVDPSGKVTTVFDNLDFMQKNKKKE